jgi:hypothetical protein
LIFVSCQLFSFPSVNIRRVSVRRQELARCDAALQYQSSRFAFGHSDPAASGREATYWTQVRRKLRLNSSNGPLTIFLFVVLTVGTEESFDLNVAC